ncbi:MAG: ParA family protein [Candidatus Jorgensenbacteria bacterium]
MARVIAIFNQKGGVGKTTTSMNLSAYLAMRGKKTLLIDFDPQFNATIGLGVTHAPDETVYHALLAGQDVERVVKPTYLTHFHLAPSSADLAGALIELVYLPDREQYLQHFVEKVRDRYDFIFIDLGPNLNLLTVNGLVAADEVIAPIQCEYFSLEGLSQLLQTITLVRENLEHPLKVTGALLTMYDKRERHSREIAREVRRRFPHKVFDVEIPRSVALAEAPHYKKPIMLYAPLSPGALAYEALADEVLREAYGVPTAGSVPPAPPMPADYPQYPRLDPVRDSPP